MGFLSEFTGTVVVDAMTGQVVEGDRPKWWVEMLRTLRHEDHIDTDQILAESLNLAAKPGSDTPDAMNIGGRGLVAQQEEILVRSIVDWNLTDEDDEPLPVGRVHPDLPKGEREKMRQVTRTSLAKLPEPLVISLKAIVARANQPRKGEAEAAFPDGGAGVVGGDGAGQDAELAGGVRAAEGVLA